MNKFLKEAQNEFHKNMLLKVILISLVSFLEIYFRKQSVVPSYFKFERFFSELIPIGDSDVIGFDVLAKALVYLVSIVIIRWTIVSMIFFFIKKAFVRFKSANSEV